jgi:hypothetical protein
MWKVPAAIYVRSEKIRDTNPESEQIHVIKEFCTAVNDLLADRKIFVTVNWGTDVQVKKQNFDAYLRKVLEEVIPQAEKETLEAASGPFRYVRVVRAVREYTKQARNMWRCAPQLALKAGKIRVKIADITRPGINPAAAGSWQFLANSRDSVFILRGLVDYKKVLHEDLDADQIRLVCHVEQKLHGAKFKYPLSVWSSLINDTKASLMVYPPIPSKG